MNYIFKRQEEPKYDARVAFIQLILGFTGIDADGLFGPNTESAVKDYQRAKGLEETGEIAKDFGEDHLNLPYWKNFIKRNNLSTPFRDPNLFQQGHEFVFKSEIDAEIQGGGHFSSKPETFVSGNKLTVRALRTNNHGALNISSWQKKMPGYVGETLADGSGNRTTIYETPEKGVIAWHELIVLIYGKKSGYLVDGKFTIERLAKAYSGLSFATPNSNPAVSGYLAGWKKWSGRISGSELVATSAVDPTNVSQLVSLAIAMFSHESSFATPLINSQITAGIRQAQDRIVGAGGGMSTASASSDIPTRKLTLSELQNAPIAGGTIDLKEILEEEQANGQFRYQRMLRSLDWEAKGADIIEEAEK